MLEIGTNLFFDFHVCLDYFSILSVWMFPQAVRISHAHVKFQTLNLKN